MTGSGEHGGDGAIASGQILVEHAGRAESADAVVINCFSAPPDVIEAACKAASDVLQLRRVTPSQGYMAQAALERLDAIGKLSVLDENANAGANLKQIFVENGLNEAHLIAWFDAQSAAGEVFDNANVESAFDMAMAIWPADASA